MKKMIVVLLTLLMITAALTACGKAQDQSAGSNASADTSAKTAETTAAASATQTAASSTGAKLSQPNEVVTTANVTSNGAINATELFSDRDLKQTADLTDAVYYDLSDNSNITITKEGVYVISGSASNVSVIIEAGDNDKVQLVFNGATISNSSAPAVYVKNADKVFVTTVEGTTTELTVSGAFTADGETNTDAVIFSKDDLVLNGLGTLTVNSSDNGISGKDDIKITGGTINITSTSDAIEANESIAIADGAITIKTSKDALHAENDEDDSTGYIYICGGTFNIAAASDAIQATTIAQIDDGNITASAVEAIEATFVQLNGGTYNLTASDDGINATSKSKSQSVKIEINGGDITVNMGQGDTDGIDSNGDLIINGGTVNVNAQSPFDYDGQGQLNGGTVYVNGSQVTELTNQMMGGGMGGGRGGMGGDPNMNGNGGPMGGGFAR
ncbi:carbohydrate-binding domain-containing protein [Ruminococcus sp.]|uniref:carbohydrate-binding domain-containing protein n=1 Tax=Ruminococcus sp. TaxID=41978 RepID=UPI002E7FB4CA|nr:carbohydrate-binding domain-containing protein [Ruminococcus sp.]MEE3491680.1 carbohydrate-binding domain-containing protein [Ruminococcus sp.]